MAKKILIAGVTGFIGRNLKIYLESKGFEIYGLTRNANLVNRHRNFILWTSLEKTSIQFDAVINLSGASILGKIWTSRYCDELVKSRVDTTQTLVHFMKSSNQKMTLIQASASGYYGHRKKELLSENSEPGSGFLANLAKNWENAARLPSPHRVCFLRTGIVLGPDGGIFRRLQTLAKFGLILAPYDENIFMPWIYIKDVVGIIEHLLLHPELHGPVNIVAPETISSQNFYRQYSKFAHRVCLPIPQFILKMLPHAMGRELFLSSQKMHPEKLLESGYQFQFPQLTQAFNDMLT